MPRPVIVDTCTLVVSLCHWISPLRPLSSDWAFNPPRPLLPAARSPPPVTLPMLLPTVTVRLSQPCPVSSSRTHTTTVFGPGARYWWLTVIADGPGVAMPAEGGEPSPQSIV